ncbi:hypothetical protein FIV42_02185 [Persicimonas caeni]|uniref:Transposase IS200-like domain-containing protein n=1 Tax=Persicimonas caeni TaxID=2292766 RepID=A0A4Y6PMZ1_PERCE|nr:transposase [Persicimonas caeni]QDG49589.1 hypothetical protein FIV42_02185 [Persicimonas caeni]QED30810.1 hypothetical protein FRD00_02180 [Persicimonas caeni]
MGHPLRQQEKDAIYEIVNRTQHQFHGLSPDADEVVNKIILGLLAKYAWIYGVEIFAFCFMSNHFHILARCKSLQLHLFMRDFQSQIARKMNALRGRTGTFWERRYTATKVLDDDAMIDRLRYTVCNPCESDLVSHPKKWPGLCSWQIHDNGEPLVGEVVDRETYWREKRKKKNEDKTEAELIEMATVRYPLELAKLPKWEDMDDEAYHQKMREECHKHAGELAKKRCRPCLGRKKVLAQKWSSRPRNPKKAPRPLCHGGDLQQREEYRQQRWDVTDDYRKAVGKWREGKTQVKRIEFPEGTIPPGHQFCYGRKGEFNMTVPQLRS